jgi:hypothetical protein
MSEFEFVNFEKTPEEKHLGIASVKAYGKILLRYKVIPTKCGKGYFISPFRARIVADEQEIYTPAFVIDSKIDDEEITTVIRAGIKSYLGGTNE